MSSGEAGVPSEELAAVETRVTRLGVVLEPNGDPTEVEGVLNPATARTRDGRLLLYPRVVARGNASRIAICEAHGDPTAPRFERIGFALEPQTDYEHRSVGDGYGCEDPRITFVPLLDSYVMAYTAFGPLGPRIAVAVSADGYAWERLGLVDFSAPGLPNGDDKDAAFFPEPVMSPGGRLSFAMYHRPMHHVSAIDGRAAAQVMLDLPPEQRESTRIAYVPLEPALADRKRLLTVAESALVLAPGDAWGRVKNGAGTPPLRVDEGWFSLFHGVDPAGDAADAFARMRYSAGIVLHDAERPHDVRFRSPHPVLTPETAAERHGTVDNVVFPTGIDVPPGAPPRSFDVYYGMADARIGRARVEVGAVTLADEASAA